MALRPLYFFNDLYQLFIIDCIFLLSITRIMIVASMFRSTIHSHNFKNKPNYNYSIKYYIINNI